MRGPYVVLNRQNKNINKKKHVQLRVDETKHPILLPNILMTSKERKHITVINVFTLLPTILTLNQPHAICWQLIQPNTENMLDMLTDVVMHHNHNSPFFSL